MKIRYMLKANKPFMAIIAALALNVTSVAADHHNGEGHAHGKGHGKGNPHGEMHQGGEHHGHDMKHENMGQGENRSGSAMREVMGHGRVNKVMAKHGMVNIKHEPMPDMNWPEMSMNFKTQKEVDLSGLKPGQQVDFTLLVDDENNYVIKQITTK